jgi:valyl-tRNA synthetase
LPHHSHDVKHRTTIGQNQRDSELNPTLSDYAAQIRRIIMSPFPESAIALIGDMRILIPLAGVISKEAERARLEKEIDKLLINIEKRQRKMGQIYVPS